MSHLIISKKNEVYLHVDSEIHIHYELANSDTMAYICIIVNSIFNEDDHVLVFTLKGKLPEVEKFFY